MHDCDWVDDDNGGWPHIRESTAEILLVLALNTIHNHGLHSGAAQEHARFELFPGWHIEVKHQDPTLPVKSNRELCTGC